MFTIYSFQTLSCLGIPKDCIAMGDLRSQQNTKSTTSSRQNSDVSIGSQINTMPSRSLSENNYIYQIQIAVLYQITFNSKYQSLVCINI